MNPTTRGRRLCSFLPLPLPPLSFFGSCFISRAAKTENPVPRSFFAPKPNGNACYWKFFIPFPDVKSQLQSSKCHCSGQRNACSHLNPVPIFNFCKCFLACVARVSVRFRCKQRGTRVTQCYCFLEFQTRAPKNSGTLYPRLSRLLLKDLFVRIIS